jgi:hypothetical protein
MGRKKEHALMPALLDEYHALHVLLEHEDQGDPWFGHPWVDEIGVPDGGWDCTFDVWSTAFAPRLPDDVFRLVLRKEESTDPLAPGIQIEPRGKRWVVRDEQGAYWCEVQGNAWADSSIPDIAPLTFRTAALAKSAYLQASRMYDERAERQAVAYAVLGIGDDE